MSKIDIPLPDALTDALKQPVCLDLRLPKPKIPELKLPTGGRIKGISDFTRGIPTDCSMNFTLTLQIAPIMASMECLLKVLKFIGVAVEIAKSMTNPVKVVTGIPKIVSAAADLKDCIAMTTPIGMACFVKDLLLLIARMLRCTLQALDSVIKTLDGLELDLQSALAAGDEGALASLECAKENAELAAAGAMTSIEPILVLLSLAEPFFAIANAPKIEIPKISAGGGLAGLKSVVETLTPIVDTVETVAEGIPC
jgi:hypothetical protein